MAHNYTPATARHALQARLIQLQSMMMTSSEVAVAQGLESIEGRNKQFQSFRVQCIHWGCKKLLDVFMRAYEWLEPSDYSFTPDAFHTNTYKWACGHVMCLKVCVDDTCMYI